MTIKYKDREFLIPVLVFTARRYAERGIGLCYGNSVCPSVCPSVCLSVRHTGGSVKNGWT